MSIHQERHALIDKLADEDAEEILDYIRWLLADEDTLTREELELMKASEEQIERGEFITLEEFRCSPAMKADWLNSYLAHLRRMVLCWDRFSEPTGHTVTAT